MASVLGTIVKGIVRNFASVNPGKLEKKNVDFVKNLRGMETVFKTYIPPIGYSVKKHNVDGLPIEVFSKNKGGNDKLIFVIHGGAYVTRLAFIYRWMNRTYSRACGGGDVLLFDYRCSPEYKYPCALEDAMKAWDWALANGYKEENIITVGDSAGGHLNISLLMKLREQNRKMPKGAAFISPWLDMTCSGESYRANYPVDPLFGIKGEQLSNEDEEKFKKSEFYAWHGTDNPYDPYISPIFAEFDDTYPPSIITVGGYEMLLSDSQTLYNNLTKAGVNVTLNVMPEMFHCFNLYRIFPEAKTAVKQVNDFISQTLV